MKVGRNDLCPCGSGKKYKQCCLKAKQDLSLQSKIILSLGGVILIVCLILLVSSIRNYGGEPTNRVWSEEHQHWHNL